MFSQQQFKRMNINSINPYSQGPNPNYMVNPQMMQQNMYQDTYPMYNDTMSMYSSNSTNSTVSNIKRRNSQEEFNLILANCLEEFLPKIAEECAESVYSVINDELEKQANEINEIKTKLENLDSLNANCYFDKLQQKNCTPKKIIRNISFHLNNLNSIILKQAETYNENVNMTEGEPNFYKNLEENLNQIKQIIEEERTSANLIDTNLKDRCVDLLSLKNYIADQIDYLINQIKLNEITSVDDKDELTRYKAILSMLDNFVNELTDKNSFKKKFTGNELECQNIESRFVVSSMPSHSNNNYQTFNSVGITIQNKNRNIPNKTGKFSSFNTFSF